MCRPTATKSAAMRASLPSPWCDRCSSVWANATKSVLSWLYLARRRAENTVREHNLGDGEYFYVNSLSSRRVLYKGMLLSDQLATYFPELSDERVESAVAFVHQRYSTNTFPTWDLAQPFRLAAHNGEINTVRGNVNRMRAREAIFDPPAPRRCDSCAASGDRSCGFGHGLLRQRAGAAGPGWLASLEHAMAMMVPEAWATKAHLDPALRDFFEYHATLRWNRGTARPTWPPSTAPRSSPARPQRSASGPLLDHRRRRRRLRVGSRRPRHPRPRSCARIACPRQDARHRHRRPAPSPRTTPRSSSASPRRSAYGDWVEART